MSPAMIPASSVPVVLASAWTTAGVVLLWIVAAVGGLITLFVLVPIHLRAEGGVHDQSLEGQVWVRWAWGVLTVGMTPDRTTTVHLLGWRIWTFHQGGSKDKPDPEPKPKKKKAKGWLQWLAQHRQTGLQFVRRLIHTLRLQLQVRGELGLGDPARTALLSRLLWELNRVSPALSINVEPDWMEEHIGLDGALRARVWLAHLGLVLLGGLLNHETRRMIRTVPRAGG